MFNREFINKGLLNKELGKFYTKMFEFRQKADYKDMVKFKKEDVGDWLESVGRFISEVEKAICFLPAPTSGAELFPPPRCPKRVSAF